MIRPLIKHNCGTLRLRKQGGSGNTVCVWECVFVGGGVHEGFPQQICLLLINSPDWYNSCWRHGKERERATERETPLHSGFPMLHRVDCCPSAPLIKRHICQPARLIMAASPYWLIFMESTSLTELLEMGDVGRKSRWGSECCWNAVS